MKTNHKTTKNKISILLLALLSCIILVIIALTAQKVISIFNSSDNHPKQNKQSKNESEINSNNKKKFIENQTDGNSTSTTPTSDNINLTASKTSNDYVTVSSQLTGYSDGTCSLTIENNGITYSQEAAILYQSSFSTCAGFSVPISELGNGNWQITLSITSKGTTNAKTISSEIK